MDLPVLHLYTIFISIPTYFTVLNLPLAAAVSNLRSEACEAHAPQLPASTPGSKTVDRASLLAIADDRHNLRLPGQLLLQKRIPSRELGVSRPGGHNIACSVSQCSSRVARGFSNK